MKLSGNAIKDFKHKKVYTQLVEKTLFGYLWDMLFKPMFKIAAIKPIASNDNSIILEALKKGEIVYAYGGFMATHKFSNELSKELIKLGAKYNKYNKVYEISFDQLPTGVVNYINRSQQIAIRKLNQINDFLYDLEFNLNHYVDTMIFNNEAESIIKDARGQIIKNASSINVIVPELTEQQMQQIKADYTTNMQYYIKKWSEKHIIEMRQKVQKAVLEGYREDEVQKMLQNEYGIAARKAKFLAQNETSIMLAQYKKVTYQEMGFDKFIWNTILDGKERESHKKLNGKIFSFDNPPVIDDRTGQRGLPGETYNCRCGLIPYRDNNIFNVV